MRCVRAAAQRNVRPLAPKILPTLRAREAVRLTCRSSSHSGSFLRLLGRGFSTEPASSSARSFGGRDPLSAREKQQLNLDFGVRPSPSAPFEEAPDSTNSGKTSDSSTFKKQQIAERPSWPPPEDESVIITFNSPWVAAIAVLLVIAAIEFVVLERVVTPEGERKLLKKVTDRIE